MAGDFKIKQNHNFYLLFYTSMDLGLFAYWTKYGSEYLDSGEGKEQRNGGEEEISY